MSSYLTRASTPVTPQSEPLPGQVPNKAGGHGWQLGPMPRLARFLILGSEGGTYYTSERDLTRENIACVREALDEKGSEAVEEIVRVSVEGRAPKNDPALYALAVATAHPDEQVRKAALGAIPEVARTGTMLFHLAEWMGARRQRGKLDGPYLGMRGWGPAAAKGISAWYERDVREVAYQCVKYRQRDGWTHRDLLRLAHPKAPTPEHRILYDWICGREASFVENARTLEAFEPIEAFMRAQAANSATETAALVREYGGALPREALKREFLNSQEVWEALIEAGMPMTAMIRNLANMTRIGVLRPMSESTTMIAKQLADPANIKRARIHPAAILGAMAAYGSGYSARGSNQWSPLGAIIDALDAAFYSAFDNVPPTGKRHLLALDVSSSMNHGGIAGMPGLTPRVGSAAMLMATARSGDPYATGAFTTTLTPLAITPRQRLDDIVRLVNGMPFGGTDCALPMLYAGKEGLEIDTFIVYTDSETWAGAIHPAEALRQYRRATGIDAKLIVVAMTSQGFSIADPNDPGMLDVVGFDSSAPAVMADFTKGWAA